MDITKFQINVDKVETAVGIERWAKAHMLTLKFPEDTPAFMGIDPGSSFGVAIIYRGSLGLFWGDLLGDDEVDRMFEASQVSLYYRDVFNPKLTVVEGPAPKFAYRQAFLGHMRAGFILGAMPHVLMLPPSTIRMLGFGHGNESGLNLWPRVNENAIAAFGCALAAMKKSPS